MAYRDVVLADRPIVYWPLGDGSSAVPSPDLAGRGGATPTHTALTYAAPGVSQEKSNGFVTGSSSRMAVASGAANPGDTCSYEIWVRRGVTGTTQAIISSVDSGYYLRFNPDNTIHMLRSQVTDALGSSTAYADTSKFIHIVNTNHPTIGRFLWVNAKLDGSVPGASTGFGNSGVLFLNVENAALISPGTQNLWGFAVYNYVLSAAQILNHYQAGLGARSGASPARLRMR